MLRGLLSEDLDLTLMSDPEGSEIGFILFPEDPLVAVSVENYNNCGSQTNPSPVCKHTKSVAGIGNACM